jgi:tripartite-type tricarboxylate transporter receptor subunit TctC
MVRNSPLLFAVALSAWLAPSALAQQKFPSKPIRIVTTSPGATPDMLARLIGAKMSDNWGQPVVIENRPAVIGNSMVAKATPDGYTLLLTSALLPIHAVLFSALPYNPLKDFAGVTEIGNSNTVLVVGTGLGVKSVRELVAYAHSRPGKVFFATGSAGSADHLNVERFRYAAGIKAQHVSFKGQSDALLQVAAGRAHFTSSGQIAALPFISDGKLVALAQRAPILPGVPLIADVVPEWTSIGAHGILAPAGTSIVIRQQISKAVARILSLADIRERLNAVGYQIAPTTPEEQERKLRLDIAAFAKIVRDIGLKPEN